MRLLFKIGNRKEFTWGGVTHVTAEKTTHPAAPCDGTEKTSNERIVTSEAMTDFLKSYKLQKHPFFDQKDDTGCIAITNELVAQLSAAVVNGTRTHIRNQQHFTWFMFWASYAFEELENPVFYWSL